MGPRQGGVCYGCGGGGRQRTTCSRQHLLIITVVLLIALIALGVWVVRDRQNQQAQAPASKEAVAALEGRIAAWMQGDEVAAAAFYEENGTLEEMDQSPPIVTQGRAAIAKRLQDLIAMDVKMKPAGAPVQVGH